MAKLRRSGLNARIDAKHGDYFRRAYLWVVLLCHRSFAFLSRSSSVDCRASKEDKILIWIRNYKGFGAPWLFLQRLMEEDSCSLIAKKQLFDFVRGANRDGSGEQMFALANIACEHRFEDQPQGESRIVAEDLPIIWRNAIDEFDREAELACVEITGTLDVRNKELRRD
jgi:hypothetical protein